MSQTLTHSSSLFLSLLALYASLRLLSLSSLLTSLSSPRFHVAADFSVIYAMNYPCYGSPYKPYLEDQ